VSTIFRKPGRAPVRALAALALTVAVLAGCWPSVGTRFAETGPFSPVSVRQDSVTTYYWPTNLGSRDRKHPVILWGNGTFVNPTHYDAYLRHFASHGFIVAAANTTNAGTGREMLAGLDSLTAFNSDPASPFHQKVDLTRVGATGHSQGGAGAIAAGLDPRVDTVVVQEAGGNGNPAGPVLFLAGEADTTVPPSAVKSRYQAEAGPAAYGNLTGASHVSPLVNGNEFRGPVTAWFRWQLMGDRNARDQFVPPCGYCTSPAFVEYEANAALLALYPS
jgi:pimeloyl-ACP methyl ester carboxylesterase